MGKDNYKKVREYKRDTVCRTLIGFLERCHAFNNGEVGEFESNYIVKNAVIFGSFVNSQKEKVHDLDINVEMGPTTKGKKMTSREFFMYAAKAPKSFGVMHKLAWASDCGPRYIKASSPIISINEDELDWLSGRKVQIIKNGKIIKKNVIAILRENNYPIPENVAFLE